MRRNGAIYIVYIYRASDYRRDVIKEHDATAERREVEAERRENRGKRNVSRIRKDVCSPSKRSVFLLHVLRASAFVWP